MNLLYVIEHVNCYNYSKDGRTAIESFELQKGEQWDVSTLYNKVIFFISGTVEYSFDGIKKTMLESRRAITVPARSQLNLTATEDLSFTVFRLYDKVQLCDRYSLEKLLIDNKRKSNWNNKATPANYIAIDQRLDGYLSLLNAYIASGFRCTYFFKIKTQELFFLLRAYYPKDELLRFFYPLLENNSSFSEFVYENYAKVKSVKELANMANYSLSGFQKHFKRTFGISAYKWLIEQRSKSIYRELNNTDRPLKEISEEFGFSSPSHFNDFCKIQFGNTPGDIRRNR